MGRRSSCKNCHSLTAPLLVRECCYCGPSIYDGVSRYELADAAAIDGLQGVLGGPGT